MEGVRLSKGGEATGVEAMRICRRWELTKVHGDRGVIVRERKRKVEADANNKVMALTK